MKNLLSVLAFLGILLCYSCEKAQEEVPVESVTLSQATAEMYIGETTQLKANVLPSNATDKTVTWASSKQSVATVSDNGLVTALAEGTSTITASAGSKSATCTIQVSKKVIEVTAVELDLNEVEIVEGESLTLIATVKPDDATDKTVTWDSSDKAIATVDDNGKVTAVKEGKATITAKAGGKQASCSITVAKRVIAVESITLNKSELALEKGDSETLVATVKPDDATNRSVTWSSSDDKVASIDQAGKITAIGGGEAIISAKAGEKTATCKVTVTVPIESISLDNTSLSLEEGQSATLVATVKPDDASDKTVSWGSSDEKIATVENGKVSAIKEGSVTITAAAGDKKATCKVTVQKKVVVVASVSLSQTAITLYEGQSTTLVATVKPDNATDKTVTWSSSASEIASVDQEGKVSAIKAGSATITAMAGDKTATCSVTVIQPSNGPEAVDLGLSVKWASYNVGATKPEEFGDYFAWGEISPKNTYDWSTYKWCNYSYNSSYTSLTKYNTSPRYGTVDNKTQLEMSDDVARANWGGKWRLPTKEEFDELKSNCTWTWTTQSGTEGYQVTSKKNGNSIFLPAAGYRAGSSTRDVRSYGYVWSSSLDNVFRNQALYMYFGSGAHGMSYDYRCFGLSVRPVSGDVTSVSLRPTSLSLTVGGSAVLTATVYPSKETVTWTSSNTSVATVSNGTVTTKAAGTATITATAGGKSATCSVTVIQPSNGPEAVDLGLSVKWASYNVGATKPEEYGDYFAWGEIPRKNRYDWSTYKWCNFSYNSLTKYNTSPSYGTVDNKAQLEMSDDVARANWGGKWRLPTKEEFDELKSNCTWTWTTQSGTEGFKVTSKKNGNSIFLPAAGDWYDGSSAGGVGYSGHYWSSSLRTDCPNDAWEMYFGSGFHYMYSLDRFYGLSVRPVTEL